MADADFDINVYRSLLDDFQSELSTVSKGLSYVLFHLSNDLPDGEKQDLSAIGSVLSNRLSGLVDTLPFP